MNQDSIPLPDEGDPDPDIHGKLAHLNAVDLRPLSLSARYAYVTLLHPSNSDELGRFMTHGGALPPLPALSDKQARAAIDGLLADKQLRSWLHRGSTCWELAGGYAYKPDLKKQLYERRRLAKQKRDEAAKRRQRKKDADEGIPFAYEDDGTDVSEGKVIEKIRSKRGNHIPTRHGVWFNSKVPPPKGKQRYKMLIDQPDKTEGCVLRMLPSFNPGEDLSALGAVLRFYLLMECDDYGRVALDVGRLHQQLGPAITKRVSKVKIEAELAEMERLGHLIAFEKRKGRFAYLLDSAQHMKTKKHHSREIPRMHEAWDFTYDTDEYTAFFDACKKHSSTRTTVRVGNYNERGDVNVVSEYVEVAAGRFVEQHEKWMAREPYCTCTPGQLLGRDPVLGAQCLPYENAFWYAANNLQVPAEWLEQYHFEHREELDGEGDSEAGKKHHKILTHLLGMTPAGFVERAKADDRRPAAPGDYEEPARDPREEDRPPVVPDDEDEPFVVPVDDDDVPPMVPFDDEEVTPLLVPKDVPEPQIVPSNDVRPMVVPDDEEAPSIAPSDDERPMVVPFDEEAPSIVTGDEGESCSSGT